MINEDEKRWHARNIVTELGYCGNYMRDRKTMTNMDIRFYAYIMRKAYYMLKEQEPKLLTFDEVKKHFLVPKELFGSIEEYIDYVNDIDPLYMECNVEDAFVFHWRTHDDISMHLDDWKNEYGKTWRCWTKKPTPEQMKGVKWDV